MGKQGTETRISTTEKVPLLFFSGMAADESIFLPQGIVFPGLIVLPWQVPTSREDLASYCARLAKEIDPGCPCIVGGASFGGIVAQEMTKHLNVYGCILVGSIREPDEIPLRVRGFRPLVHLLRFLPLALLQVSAKLAIPLLKILRFKHLAGLARQFSNADRNVLRWSIAQLLNWKGTSVRSHIRHIHGAQDFVFPVSKLQPDTIIEGGGHVISLTHPREVNEFIRESLALFQPQPKA